MTIGKAQKSKSMRKIDFIVWLFPWVTVFLATCGLGLVATEVMLAVVIGEHWLNAEWVIRIGWMSAIYLIFFVSYRVSIRT